MWPFKKTPIRYESPELIAFENALATAGRLIELLEAGAETVSDDTLRDSYFDLERRMQSNCDAVASGLLSVVGAICVHAEHLTDQFLPSAIQPIYYLGIEELTGIQAYIKHVAKMGTAYLDLQTKSGSEYLIRISEDDELIVNAFRCMYDLEDNDWRKEDSDTPNVPPILAG